MAKAKSADERRSPLLRLGTSSWSSTDWKGVFYSASAAPADFIAEYAQRFSTVEIDSTFYRIPAPSVVRGWRDRTPAGFLFSAKVPQIITHEKLLVDCQDDLAAFLKSISNLGDRLGPLLLQFPYFAKKSGIDAEEFLKRLRPFLDALPKGEFQFVVEARNKMWIAPPLLDCLAEHRVPLALIDHPWMWPPRQLFQRKGILTGPFAYVRWLGDRGGIEKITKTWGQTVIDRAADMAAWVDPLKALLEQRVPVYGYFNNHYSGYAPADVERFVKMMANLA
ncbi:MAG: DUF72 domain-containing protein [Candidatus Sumerlaeota bacterium]|nr:DUF72 domain-containing protein [Candidatus Sumerlaeota bacterium]